MSEVGKISVLYIHPHGAFGGASRSLLEMIRAFPPGSVSPHVISPRGNVGGFFRRAGIPLLEVKGISLFDNTQFGYYRRLRWLLLLREVYLLPFTIYALLRAKTQWRDIQLVHVNDITALVPILLARVIFRKPIVVHVRCMQRDGKRGLRTRLVSFILRRYASRVIAIDETVKKSLGNIPAEVVHNGFSPAREEKTNEDLVGQFKFDGLKVAMVGNLLPLKGVYDFLEAAAICHRRGVNARFFVIGDNTRNLGRMMGGILRRMNFAHDVKKDLEQLIHMRGLDECFRLVSATPDIKQVYDNINVLCFPSHLNAVGRPVFEAAFSRVPSIVAIRDPLEDTLIDGETGIRIDQGDAVSLADAVEYFCARPDEVERMGEEAYRLAMKNFDIRKNAAHVDRIYCDILGVQCAS